MFIVGLSYNVPQMPSSYCCWGLSTAIINCLYSEGTGVSRQLFVQDVGSQTIFRPHITLLYLDDFGIMEHLISQSATVLFSFRHFLIT